MQPNHFKLAVLLACVAIGGASTQAATFSLGTTALLESPAAGSNSVVLAASPDTAGWTNTANASWLHLTPANTIGIGSTNIVFGYDTNTGATRTGTLTIGGQTLTVTQAGSTYVQAPGPLTTLASSGLSEPEGVAVDTSGNVFFADANNNAIKEWVVVSNSVVTLVSNGLSYPEGVAVDTAGDVYFADNGDNAIKKWVAASNTVVTLVSNGLSNPFGVALDVSGNVYIGDANNNAVKEWIAASHTVITLVSSGLKQPQGVAVDAAGNVYIADHGNDAIKEWLAANSNVITLVAVGTGPEGLAVNGPGNVYYAATSDNAIGKWMAAGNIATTLISSGLDLPSGVARDAAGTLFIANWAGNNIKELPYAYVIPTAKSEAGGAGSDVLPLVLPTTVNMRAPFAPTSTEPWLTISGVTGGAVLFAFTANTTGSSRATTITVLGQAITVTQSPTAVPLVTWTNIAGGDWSVAANWSPNQVPGAADTTVLPDLGFNYVVTLDEPASVSNLIVGAASGPTTQTFNNTSQTLTVNGVIQVNAQGAFNLSAGTLGGTNVLEGKLSWSGGALTGVMTVSNNGVLNIAAGNGVVQLYPVTLTNYGTVNWTNATLWSGAGTQIYNYGLWNAQSDNGLLGGIYGGGTTLFDNFGTLLKSGNTGITTFDGNVVFKNTGTVNVQSGTVSLSTYNLTGGTLNFGISGPANYGVITLAGSPALTGTISANLINNYIPTVGTAFEVLTFTSSSGAFTDTELPPVAVWQTSYNPGNVTLTVFGLQLSGVVFTLEPVGATNVSIGADVSFTAVGESLSSPTAPIQYQWRLNGVIIAGATTSELSYQNVQATNGGRLTVTISDGINAATSIPVGFSVAIPTMTASGNTPFSSRFALVPAASFALRSSTTNQIRESGEPSIIAGNPGGKPLWFQWQPTNSGTAVFSTQGSDFDTILGVYTGTNLSDLTRVPSCVNDDDSGGFLTSKVLFNCFAGTNYEVVVDGYWGASGNVVLSWVTENFAAPLPTLLQVPPRQTVTSNGAAVTLVCLPTSGTPAWLFNGALTPVGGPDFLISAVDYTNVGTYVSQTTLGGGLASTQPARVQINLLEDGTSDPNSIAWNKFLDSVNAAYGIPPPPAIRKLGGGGDTRGLSVAQTFSTVGYQAEPGEPSIAGQIGGSPAWYTYVTPTNGAMLINTAGSSFNTLLGVFVGPGDSFATLTNVGAAFTTNASVNGQPQVNIPNAPAGQTYFIVVDGYNGASGVVQLNINLGNPIVIAAPPQDQFVSPGSNAIFTVDASGSTPLSYTWQFDGTNISGATNDTLIVSNVQAANTGAYTVVLSNLVSMASDSAMLLFSNTLRLGAPAFSGSNFQLQLTGAAGGTYVLQASTNLMTWTSLITNTATNGLILLTDTNAGNFESRFYRGVTN